MRGEISSGKHAKRHPLDWYVDEIWCARQLRAALNDFRLEREQGLSVWDPCCGMGNTLTAAWEAGLATIGSDLANNFAWEHFDGRDDLIRPEWFSADFLEIEQAPKPCTTIFNPPYSYIRGILEAFVRHALTVTTGRVCALVPSKWLASQARFKLFMVDHPPAAVLHLSQRPSMPPGDLIKAMGKRAFRGGKVDYCWIVWDVSRPTRSGDTRTVWLPPLAEPIALVEVLA